MGLVIANLLKINELRKIMEENVMSIAIIVSKTFCLNTISILVCRAHIIIKYGMAWMTYVCSLLIAYSSQICGNLSHLRHPCAIKIIYKTVFLYKSSWKVESAQLENFYFSTGKLFFLSWKIKISQ